MLPYVIKLDQVNRIDIMTVGGKGANLGELLQAGFPVPPGFCITTSAYDAVVGQLAQMNTFLEELDKLTIQQIEDIQHISQRMKAYIEGLPISDELLENILHAWRETGDRNVYAVRSSATAEDLPTASFAGQQDTFLNVKGERQLIDTISKCWSSLFSERAIIYRIKNGYDHRAVRLAVIVQKMINPDVAGVMFTADPVTGNRKVISIDASFGLGEALVSGIVNPDSYQVKQGVIVKKQVSHKKTAVLPLAEGGTTIEQIPEQKQKTQALADETILALAQIGEQIEAHYGAEQDIEWCLSNGQLYIVQARPITTLFPVPEAPDDELHVYASGGHIQMMTDAMTPAGLSLWKHLSPEDPSQKGTEQIEQYIELGGRLYYNITHALHSVMARKVMLHIMNKFDPLISSAARQIMHRFPIKDEPMPGAEQFTQMVPFLASKVLKHMLEGDGEIAYKEVRAFADHCLEKCQQGLKEFNGADRIVFIQKNLSASFQGLMGNDMPYMVAGFVALESLTTLAKWWSFSEEDVLVLNKSLPYNVTGELGLELGDLADLARDYPELTAYLRNAPEAGFMEGLDALSGGKAFRSAFEQWLERYGARCPGEIDIARTRWSERPQMLISSIVGHLDSVKRGEHRERFRQGELEAEEAAERILTQVRSTDDGEFKARIVSRLITVYRSFMGLREHHKFVIVRHFEHYKRVLLEESDQLVGKGVLRESNDIFFLSLSEIADVITDNLEQDVQQLIVSRKESFEHYQRLQPPRMITSEGEIIEGILDRSDVPDGALLGTPVSSGIVEGRARVVLDPSTASLKEGEILVAPFTDPGWTPLFQQAKGIITEVGGLMTHGAVVAREYALPAVVGVDHATKLIKDGEMVRIDGTKGYVLVLEEAKLP